MSAAAEETYSTTAFSGQFGQATTTATTSQHADVFARRQRHPAAVYRLKSTRIPVTIPIGQHGTVLVELEPGARLPSWIPAVIDSLSQRWGVQPGWDSYDARPTQLEKAVELLNHLSAVMTQDDSMAPIVTPLSDGGVQAEWHRDSRTLELVVPADEPARYYYCNAATGEEEGDDIESKYARVQELIKHF